MMTPIATRFVDWDIPELSTLQDSKVYQLRMQLNKGIPMCRQQKADAQREQQCFFQKVCSACGLPI